MAGAGLALGALLGFAFRRLGVEEDPRVTEIRKALPGANCGACGYPGCQVVADAVAGGQADVRVCVAGGHDVAAALAEIMGVPLEGEVCANRAVLHCRGGLRHVPARYVYDGPLDCFMAQQLAGGPLSCTYGCLGMGSCVRSCPFDALKMGDEGLPVVDPEKCTGCGLCLQHCPRSRTGLLTLEPCEAPIGLACASRDTAKWKRTFCDRACIACKACEKVCPERPKAIAVDPASNLAVVDYERCTGCGKCVEKCPTGCIVVEPAARGARPSIRVDESAQPGGHCATVPNRG